MIMQVHDELVFEVAENDAATVERKVVDIMCNDVELVVPVKVAVGTGSNWDEAH